LGITKFCPKFSFGIRHVAPESAGGFQGHRLPLTRSLRSHPLPTGEGKWCIFFRLRITRLHTSGRG
jgi:hypothetical protein